MCGKYIELLSPYLDGELTQQECIELEAHLKACPSCRKTLELYREISSSISQDVSAPAGLSESIMSAVYNVSPEIEEKSAAPAPEKSRNRRHRLWIRFASLAAVVAIVILSVYSLDLSSRSDKGAADNGGTDMSACGTIPESAGEGAGSGSYPESPAAAPDMPEAGENGGAAGGQLKSENTLDSGAGSDSAEPEPAEDDNGGAPIYGEGDEYYTVITINGSLPENLSGCEAKQVNTDTYHIIVSRSTADELIEDGFEYSGIIHENSDSALVIYTESTP